MRYAAVCIADDIVTKVSKPQFFNAKQTMGTVRKVLLLSNTAALGTSYEYKVVQYMLKMIKPVSTQIHKKERENRNFCPPRSMYV